jgi:hypothetical protein
MDAGLTGRPDEKWNEVIRAVFAFSVVILSNQNREKSLREVILLLS